MKRIVSLLVVVLMLTSTLSGVVVAQSDDEMSFFDQLATEGDQGADGIVRDAVRGALGSTTTTDKLIADLFTDAQDPEQHATEFQDSFNENNQSIETYVNDRVNASTSLDVIEITFENKDGENATRYLVADVQDDAYANARVVNTTNRTVDESITAEWYLARNAGSELDTFVSEYAEPNENITLTYELNMYRKYSSSVTGAVWPAPSNNTTSKLATPGAVSA